MPVDVNPSRRTCYVGFFESLLRLNVNEIETVFKESTVSTPASFGQESPCDKDLDQAEKQHIQMARTVKSHAFTSAVLICTLISLSPGAEGAGRVFVTTDGVLRAMEAERHRPVERSSHHLQAAKRAEKLL